MTSVIDLAETQTLQHLGLARIVAQASLATPAEVGGAGPALVRGGIHGLELLQPTPRLIRLARAIDGLIVGAGNIHTVADAEAAHHAGAHYATAPATSMELIHACRELEFPFIPGAATPSEIERLTLMGVRTIRLYPAALLGGA